MALTKWKPKKGEKARLGENMVTVVENPGRKTVEIRDQYGYRQTVKIEELAPADDDR